MKKLFFLILPIFSVLALSYGCDGLFPEPECNEGVSRITVTRLDGAICCPEGCDCLSRPDQGIWEDANVNTAPNDTISLDPTNPGGGDPIDESCESSDDERGLIVDKGTDGEMLITFHEANFEELKASGRNLLEEDNHFTRVYNLNLNQIDPYFITIVRAEGSNKIIRLGYKKESLFIDRISLN